MIFRVDWDVDLPNKPLRMCLYTDAPSGEKAVENTERYWERNLRDTDRHVVGWQALPRGIESVVVGIDRPGDLLV